MGSTENPGVEPKPKATTEFQEFSLVFIIMILYVVGCLTNTSIQGLGKHTGVLWYFLFIIDINLCC